MSDQRFVVTTFRIPKEIHGKAKEYIKESNRTIRWDEKRMSLTILIGKALDVYMKIHPLVDETVVQKPKTFIYRKPNQEVAQ